MKSDDVASVIAERPGGPADIHVGEVVFWNAHSGGNQVRILGTLMTNLPTLNIGDSTNLRAGMWVVVQKVQSVWYIVGRVSTVDSGDWNALGARRVDRVYASNFAINVATTLVPLTSGFGGELIIPQWASFVSLQGAFKVNVHNQTAATRFVETYMDLLYTDDEGVASVFAASALTGFNVGAGSRNTTPEVAVGWLDVQPGSTISARLAIKADAAMVASAWNIISGSWIVSYA